MDILRLIMKYGFLLVPEKEKLGDSYQRRMCFTALARHELEAHSKSFGPVALEFEVQELFKLGAIPAVYLPLLADSPSDLSGAGSMILKSLDQIEKVFEKLKDDPRPSALAQQLDRELRRADTNFHELRWVAAAFRNLFYATGRDTEMTVNPLGYYQQREWKLIENFARKDSSGNAEWDLTKPVAVIRELIAGNPWLRNRISDDRRFVDQSLLLSSVAGVKVTDFIKRIIVPYAISLHVEGIVRGRIEVVSSERYLGTDGEDGAGI